MDLGVIDRIFMCIKASCENEDENFGALWMNPGRLVSLDPELTKTFIPIFGASPFCGGFLEDLDPLQMAVTSKLFFLLSGHSLTRTDIISSLSDADKNSLGFKESARKNVVASVLKHHPEILEYLTPFNSIGKIPHFSISMKDSGNKVVTTLGSIKSAYITSNLIRRNALNYSTERPFRILEIGAGYGSQCENLLLYASRKGIALQYFVCDIPSTLLFSYYYLSTTFPDIECIFIDSEQAYSLYLEKQLSGKSYIVFTIPSMLNLFKSHNFSLTINSESFLEMDPKHLNSYIDFIFNTLQPDCFYSRNRTWRTDPEGIRRNHSEIKIPSTWSFTIENENFLLDQPHIKRMAERNLISGIDNIIAFKKA